jgi:hypothetical protein
MHFFLTLQFLIYVATAIRFALRASRRHTSATCGGDSYSASDGEYENEFVETI